MKKNLTSQDKIELCVHLLLESSRLLFQVLEEDHDFILDDENFDLILSEISTIESYALELKRFSI